MLDLFGAKVDEKLTYIIKYTLIFKRWQHSENPIDLYWNVIRNEIK